MFSGRKITTTARGAYRRPEVAVAPGPAAEAIVGAGTLPELYGYAWAVVIDRAAGFILGQHDGSAWQTVEPLLPLPDAAGARHVALAFDRSARPVLAWETAAGVSVRQWDQAATTYAVRGPFAGVDPCLIADALLLDAVGDDDVVLWHLDPTRASLVARLERDLYGEPTVYAELPPPAGWHLDQAATGARRQELRLGRGEKAPKGEPPDALAFVTDYYPWPERDALEVTLGAGAERRVTTQVREPTEGLAVAIAASAARVSNVVRRRPRDELAVTIAAAAAKVSNVTTRAAGDAIAATIAAAGERRHSTVIGTDADALAVTLGATAQRRHAP